jgi:hypothetical protein
MPHKGPEPGDRRVDGLLSPRILAAMGAFDGFAARPPGYDVSADWTQTYRIWGNSGRFRFQSRNMGYLRIERTRFSEGLRFDVDHVLVNADGIENSVKAELICRDDELASPVRWRLESGFTDSSRCPRPELSLVLEGRVNDGHVTETCDGRERELGLTPPFAVDWCLFDVVQRWDGRPSEFTLLEGLTKAKAGHRLGAMDEELAAKLAADGMGPTCVYQVGRGVLPRQYWLGEAGRVVLTISNAAICVLDDEAVRKTEELTLDLIRGGVHYEY